MGCALARVQVAFVSSMTRAANGYAQATMRYGRNVGRQAIGLPDTYQLHQSGLDPSSLDGYCAYLRELAGVTRISAMTFVDVLGRLRVATGGPGAEAVVGKKPETEARLFAHNPDPLVRLVDHTRRLSTG
jgi:hypothetical protein